VHGVDAVRPGSNLDYLFNTVARTLRGTNV
jgi:hypothetical protein